MKTDIEPIVYQDEHINLCIVLRRATIMDDLRFNIWQQEALANATGADQIERYARLVVHPMCCAAIDTSQSRIVLEGETLPMPPDWNAFAHLPSVPLEIINRWHQTAERLNPQWLPQDNSEKKAGQTSSTNGLRASTSRRARGARRSNTRMSG